MTFIFLSIAAFFTAVLSGVVGMAGGVTLLSIMTFFLPWNVIIPVHGLVQLASNSSRTLFLRQHARGKIILPFFFGVPLGTVVAVLLIRELDSKTLPLLLISLLIFYSLFRPRRLPALHIPDRAFFFLGMVSGFMGILVGATGPLLAPFFLRPDLKKEEIIATKASCQLFIHLLKIPSFLFLGFNYLEHALLILVMTLATVIGARVGVHVLNRASEKVFIALYKIALLAAGVRLVYEALIAGP